jgi:hypothetical protein
MMQLVPLGRYKLAWWSPGSPDTLSSTMHDTLEGALQAAQRLGSPHLVMEAVRVGQGDYQWRVLPYGAHRLWTFGSRAYEVRWILAVILFVAALHLAAQRGQLR